MPNGFSHVIAVFTAWNLFAVCKQYKDCVRCASERYGEQCIGERVAYRVKFRKRSDPVCRDNQDTCERALCEFDSQLARDHDAVKNVFNSSYHLFWSKTGWTPEEQCSGSYSRPGSSVSGVCDAFVHVVTSNTPRPQKSSQFCCGGSSSPFRVFNSAKQKCCLDGSVVPSSITCKL